jgi:hypothetical protein
MAKGKRKSSRESGEKISETGRRHNAVKELTLGSSSSFQELDTFSAQRDELLHQNL